MKWYSIFKEWKIVLMIIALIYSLTALNLNFDAQGVIITSVESPATNYLQSGQIIVELNGYNVNNVSEWDYAVSTIEPGDTINIVFSENNQRVNAYPFIATESENETVIGVSVAEVPFSDLEFGLDLSGGTRVILVPEEEVTSEELTNIVGVLEQRLNIYGFKEIPINVLSDFSGNNYIKIELPSSVSVTEIEDLMEHEGVFEARIGNETVFTGDDVLSVCITGVDCYARVEPTSGGFVFKFQIDISEQGANNFANVTNNLTQLTGTPCYLSEEISFYLDNEELEGSNLKISCDLQGVAERSPVISGGSETQDEAFDDMKKLRSMLQTENMPVGMDIESVEIVSSVLGQEFLQNIFIVFLLAIVGVDIVIAIRYKTWKIAIPIIIVTLSEIVITLGVATQLGWTFDLSAIAGLIASVGTGVDDQIVISDEVLSKKGKIHYSLKERIKRAFFIVFATFTMSIALMIPLAFAGAGVLRGFATTTIIAISVGVLITRPAFARILELLVGEE